MCVIITKPKPIPYKKVDPEAKRKCNEKYDNANKKQITNKDQSYSFFIFFFFQ